VFVSSTFRDMQEERDALATHVFPALRERCEARGVVWGEVDLRWGITDEDAAEAGVLSICLDVIDECQVFIGLLGERYGWVPAAFDAALLEREPWLGEQTGSSVTELEIVHATLSHSPRPQDALFYFRAPAAAASREGFVEAATEADTARWGLDGAWAAARERRERLAGLKARIRDAGLTVREGYRDGRSFTQQVLDDLTSLIDDRFPEAAPASVLERDRAAHEAFADSRRSAFVDRPRYAVALDTQLASGSGPVLMTGVAGVGKSSLLADFARRAEERSVDERPGVGGDAAVAPVITHFVGASTDSGALGGMLRRLIGEIADRCGVSVEIPDKLDALRPAFAEALQRAATTGPVVLVIDGLDQLEDRGGGEWLTWLPPLLPTNVHIVVSARPGPAVEEAMQRGWRVIEVDPLGEAERRELVAAHLRQYRKSLPRQAVERIVAAQASGNALFLRVLLEELRLYGDHGTLDRRLTSLLGAADVAALYQLVLARWEADYERDRPGLVRDALTTLWAARRGLSEAELLDLLRDGELPLPSAIWSPLRLATKQMLVDHAGLFGFAHQYARDAVEDRYLALEGAQESAHQRLAGYFLASDRGPRRLEEGPWQLEQAGDWAELYELLSRPEVMLELTGSREADLRRYWARLESESQFRMMSGYAGVLSAPSDFDRGQVRAIAELLVDAGRGGEALGLYRSLERRSMSKDELQVVLGWQAVILKTGGRLDEALDLLGEQQRLCAEIGNTGGAQVSRGNQAAILQIRGDYDGALALLEEKERGARQRGARRLVADSLAAQADIHRLRGDLHRALELHRAQEVIVREIGDTVGLEVLLGSQSMVLFTLGEVDRALAVLDRQEAMARELGRAVGLQMALGMRAKILASRGERRRALDLLGEQEAICRQAGLQQGLIAALGSQAYSLEVLGEFDRALSILDEAEQLARELHAPDITQQLQATRCSVLLQLGDLEAALAVALERTRVCEQLGSRIGLESALGQHALIHSARGELDEADLLLARQEAICREIDKPRSLAKALNHRGGIRRRRGDFAGALAAYAEVESIARTLDDPELLGSGLVNRALVLHQSGERDQALRALDEAEPIVVRSAKPAMLQNLLGNRAAMLIDAGELLAAADLLQRQEKIARSLGHLEGLRSALANQAYVHELLGYDDHALPFATEAVAVGRQVASPEQLANDLVRLAGLLTRTGDPDRAILAVEEQRTIHLNRNDWPAAIDAQLNVAIAMAMAGHTQDAIETAESAQLVAAERGLADLERRAEQIQNELRLGPMR
jgi:tetratricopeptide (TPR) repeat protein